jgi:hypothetical protein
VRLEGDEVVFGQTVQPIGQTAHKAPAAAAQDHYVEELLLFRQVAFDLHDERRPGEKVGQEQAEESMPVAQCIPIVGHRTVLLVLARFYPFDDNAAAPEDLKYGVVTINEVRSERGLPPAPWGDVPWLPLNWDRTDAPRAAQTPTKGRNKSHPW